MRTKTSHIVIGILLIVGIGEGIKLHYTVKAVRISKEIAAQKRKNRLIEKEISKKKIELSETENLDRTKDVAEKELDMRISKTINYVKIKKSVSN
jgi:precorrin-3B methylase